MQRATDSDALDFEEETPQSPQYPTHESVDSAHTHTVSPGHGVYGASDGHCSDKTDILPSDEQAHTDIDPEPEASDASSSTKRVAALNQNSAAPQVSAVIDCG